MDYLNKELVSIIVPVYNSSAYIENCVNGLLCQSYKNIEIILVDDGSSDDSLDKWWKTRTVSVCSIQRLESILPS